MSSATHSVDLIKELSNAIRENASLKEAEAWWGMVQRIEADIESHPKTTKDQRELLLQLKEGVSTAIRSIREKWPNVVLHRAQIALSALQHSIERQTTGPDGWPMRQ